LKNKTIEMIDQLVERTPNLSYVLDRLAKAGKKVFLLTNSGFSYTNKLMSALLDGMNDEKPNWKDYFGMYFLFTKKSNLFISRFIPIQIILSLLPVNPPSLRKVTPCVKSIWRQAP